jgi:hypothetical protein
MSRDDMHDVHDVNLRPKHEASDVGHAEDPNPSGHGGGISVPRALRPTRPQLVAWSIASVLALVAGILYSAYRVNLGLGARDVGGVVMPPGMVMTRDTPGDAMRDVSDRPRRH